MATKDLCEPIACKPKVSSVKTLILLARDAIASVCGGCLLGFLSFFVLPCNWFGPSSEGACAYGVLWAAMGVGVVVACLLFLRLGFRTLRAQYAAALAHAAQAQGSAVLARAWLILLVVFWVQLLLVASWPAVNAEFTRAVVWLSFLAFGVASMLLLRRFQMPVFLVVVLLIPFVGMVLLPSVLLREAARLAMSNGTLSPDQQQPPLSL